MKVKGEFDVNFEYGASCAKFYMKCVDKTVYIIYSDPWGCWGGIEDYMEEAYKEWVEEECTDSCEEHVMDGLPDDFYQCIVMTACKEGR